jgi:hypothetical protein
MNACTPWRLPVSSPATSALARFIALVESHPTELLPLPLAEAHARELGLGARLVCSVVLERRGIVCALTTTDPSPVLEAYVPAGRRVELRAHTQVGAETWEYAAPFEWPVDVYSLELRSRDDARLLPLAPAMLVAMHAHGWGDPTGRTAEPCVRLSDLAVAMTALLTGGDARPAWLGPEPRIDAERVVRREAARLLRERCATGASGDPAEP